MASIYRDEISRLELLHAAHPDGLVFPHLADAYRRAGRYTQAESVLNAGLRRHSDYSSAHVVLGRLRLDQGKHSEAEGAFRRVLELDPQNHVAMEYLGRVSLEQGRLQEALDQFRRLARLKPSDEVREQIHELEDRVGELRSGARQSSSAVPASPDSGAVRRQSRPTNGAAHPRRVPAPAGRASGEPDDDPPPLSRLPEPGEVVTETMAELYARQGLHDRATSVYRQLLQRNPGDARVEAKLRESEAEVTGSATPQAQPVAAALSPERSASPPDPTIRAHLAGLLSWTGTSDSGQGVGGTPTGSAPAVDRSEVESASAVEPWARAAVSEEAPEPISEPEPAVREPRERQGGAPQAPHPTPTPGARAVPPRAAPPVPAPDAPAPAAAVPAPAAAAAGPLLPWRAPRAGPGGAEPLDGVDPVARSLIAITDMLVGLLEYRDPFFRGSSSLTRLVAENVAVEMGLTAGQRVDLALAAVLRDLGRLAMGGRLVSQTSQKTPEARRKIERHVDLALHLLEGIDVPPAVRLAVRHHHERWDGDGYPDGLAGNDIPLLARILAVVDSFAAMVSPRSYRLPRKVPDAARELREASGTQYDPAVVTALLAVLEREDQPHLGFVKRPHILLVNPDQPGAVVTAAKLCSAGYLAEVSADPAAARERLRRVPVAALVVSAEAGEEATSAFVREMRVDPLFSSLPVVVVDAADVELRVRLLESGADVCFPPGTTFAELQGTLGALVRRSIRAGKVRAEGDEDGRQQEAPWLALQGDVSDFPLTWLLQVMKYDSRTAAIGIRSAVADGAIYLQKGDAVHAQIRGGEKGEAALRRMLQWEKGRFTVQPDARPRERTISTSIMHLLLTQAVDEDHAAAGIFGAVSDRS